MAKTKGDLVLKALRKAGLYSNATLTDADPQAIEDAINDLEDMMAAWQAKGIELGYQFADTENGIMPLPDDDSGIPAWANDGVALKLAVQVCMDNVIQPSDALLTAADSAYQTICIALTKIPPLERRNDMPRGSGNKSAFTWNRFYIEKDDPSKRYMSMNTDAAPAQDSTPSGEPRNQVGSYTSKSGIQFTVE